ncbi:hypothetical protein [Niallia nealsonii]|nr:hypothetical protein [Niallia nealsonii]
MNKGKRVKKENKWIVGGFIVVEFAVFSPFGIMILAKKTSQLQV